MSETKRMRFECPICRSVVTSSVKIEFCVCGGKYKTARDCIMDMIGNAVEGLGQRRSENLNNIIDKAADIMDRQKK